MKNLFDKTISLTINVNLNSLDSVSNKKDIRAELERRDLAHFLERLFEEWNLYFSYSAKSSKPGKLEAEQHEGKAKQKLGNANQKQSTTRQTTSEAKQWK